MILVAKRVVYLSLKEKWMG